MKVSDDLVSTWQTAGEQARNIPGYYRRRLNVSAPGALYAGIVIPGKLRQITIRFSRNVFGSRVLAQSNRGYLLTQDTEDADPSDNIFVHICEATPKLPQEIFLVFCSDVLESVGRAQSESTAADLLQIRLSHWRLFFQSRSQSVLSREDYIGLYGELHFLSRCLDAGIPAINAAQSWVGPLGANQDFLFSGTAAEVKATTSNDPDVIHVSNTRQLDDLGLDALYLTHLVYDFRPEVGQSLMKLVSILRDRLQVSSDALALFNDRLSFAGITDVDNTEFAGYGLTPRKQCDYKVASPFPRIVESSLVPGISEVSYVLHLSAAESFALDGSALDAALRVCHGL